MAETDMLWRKNANSIEKRKTGKCIVCDGSVEKSNMGTICNLCKDRLRGFPRIPEREKIKAAAKKRFK